MVDIEHLDEEMGMRDCEGFTGVMEMKVGVSIVSKSRCSLRSLNRLMKADGKRGDQDVRHN